VRQAGRSQELSRLSCKVDRLAWNKYTLSPIMSIDETVCWSCVPCEAGAVLTGNWGVSSPRATPSPSDHSARRRASHCERMPEAMGRHAEASQEKREEKRLTPSASPPDSAGLEPLSYQGTAHHREPATIPKVFLCAGKSNDFFSPGSSLHCARSRPKSRLDLRFTVWAYAPHAVHDALCPQMRATLWLKPNGHCAWLKLCGIPTLPRGWMPAILQSELEL